MGFTWWISAISLELNFYSRFGMRKKDNWKALSPSQIYPKSKKSLNENSVTGRVRLTATKTKKHLIFVINYFVRTICLYQWTISLISPFCGHSWVRYDNYDSYAWSCMFIVTVDYLFCFMISTYIRASKLKSVL